MDNILVLHPGTSQWEAATLESEFAAVSDPGRGTFQFRSGTVQAPTEQELQTAMAFAEGCVPASVVVIGPILMATQRAKEKVAQAPLEVAGGHASGVLLLGLRGSRAGSQAPDALLDTLAHEAWHAIMRAGTIDEFEDGPAISRHREAVLAEANRALGGVAPDAHGENSVFGWLMKNEEIDAREFAGWVAATPQVFEARFSADVVAVWRKLSGDWDPDFEALSY